VRPSHLSEPDGKQPGPRTDAFRERNAARADSACKKQTATGFRAVAACGLRQPVATSMDGVLIAHHVAYDPDANDQNYNDVEHTVYIGRRGSFTTHGTLSSVRFARAAHALHAPPRPARH
jgi:hypothetical protein